MIWFDLDNSPHVPLFRPVMRELANRGMECLVTARDFAQTKELLDLWQIPHFLIGRHAGRNKVKKVINLVERSNQLYHAIRKYNVSLAVSHGSRTQLISARRKGIPSVLMLDYEYTESRIFNFFASVLLMPCHIPDQRLAAAGFNLRKVIRYNGFKEEIYMPDFRPDDCFRERLGIERERILVTIRPPSTVGNYHDDRSEELYRACLERLSAQVGVLLLVVNRTEREMALLPQKLLERANIRILEVAVDGLQLLWNSDLVISGGGTMNREAALLGVPTFSIFTGRRPYLDELLQQMGRLHFVEDLDQIDSIPLLKRQITTDFQPARTGLAGEIADQLMDLACRGVA